MKVLIIYDSVYGYTEKIALAITGAIAPPDEAKALRVGNVSTGDFTSYDMVIFAAPTQGGRPPNRVLRFHPGPPGQITAGKSVTAYSDTRLRLKIRMQLCGCC